MTQPMLCQTLSLTPHPRSPALPVTRLEVECARGEDGALILAFRLCARLAALRIPASGPGGCADGLWRQTCFEAFVAAPAGPAYREFNFSPSGQWAAYAFRAQRERDPTWRVAGAPSLDWRTSPDGASLRAVIPAALLPRGAPLALGLCAVLEGADGTLAYWALAHPGDAPDFHHRASLCAALGGHP